MTNGKLILPKLFMRWLQRQFPGRAGDSVSNIYCERDMLAAYRTGYIQAQARAKQSRLQELRRRKLERQGLGD